jgi:hypothetical protein
MFATSPINLSSGNQCNNLKDPNKAYITNAYQKSTERQTQKSETCIATLSTLKTGHLSSLAAARLNRRTYALNLKVSNLSQKLESISQLKIEMTTKDFLDSGNKIFYHAIAVLQQNCVALKKKRAAT